MDRAGKLLGWRFVENAIAKGLFFLLASLAADSSLGQGVVVFNNRVMSITPQVNAPISYEASSFSTCNGPAAKINGAGHLLANGYDWGGATARVALYGGPQGTSEDQLVILGTAVNFRSGSAAGYINVGSISNRVVTNVPAGQTAVLQVRVWDLGVAGLETYEEALTRLDGRHYGYFGKSSLLHVTLGTSNAPAYLIPLSPVTLSVLPLELPPDPLFRIPNNTNTCVLWWCSDRAILQAQTNAPGAGLTTNWHDVLTAYPPFIVPLPTSNKSVFYRLRYLNPTAPAE